MQTKRCSRCGETKETSEFTNASANKDGLFIWCKPCHRDHRREKIDRERMTLLDSGEPDWRMGSFSEQVREARTRLGMTQEQLGSVIGVTGTQVRLWEKGKAIPHQKTLRVLCDALSLEIPIELTSSNTGALPLDIGRCESCGKPFPVYKLGVKTCSRKCGGEKLSRTQAGEANPSWKGGRISGGNGYIKVKTPGHPDADINGYVMEHRLVMAGVIGRPLMSNESVHHKNGCRSDNRPENLELWSGRKDPPGQRVSDLIEEAMGRTGIAELPESVRVGIRAALLKTFLDAD